MQTTPNTSPEEYDFLVLGSGEAGKYLAWTMARKGLRTAVIERRYVGGSCPNIACLPTKNVIHSAKVANYFWRAHEFGISKENTRIDMHAVRDRKRKMVDGLVQMHHDIYKTSGTELVIGTGRFVGPRTIEVELQAGGTRLLRGEKVVISTGSRAMIEPIPGLRESEPLTHIEILEADEVPPRLLIIGGGYIGLEMAQAMRRFGSDVTIIERNAHLLHREDPDVTEELEAILREEGVQVMTDIRINRVEGTSGTWVKLHVTQGRKDSVIEGSHLLIASGRTPNTSGIGLDRAGVKVNDRGFVKVNDRLETTAAGVWAVGDCAGSPHFTHIAYDDFRIVRDNLSGRRRVTNGRQVPFCMFTDPELARIGLSETEAKTRKIPYRLAKIPMMTVLRTRTLSETRGFMKALIDTNSDRILGFTALGADAGELIAVVQVAMLAGTPYTTLRDAIFTHPTMAEGLISLFSNVPARQA